MTDLETVELAARRAGQRLQRGNDKIIFAAGMALECLAAEIVAIIHEREADAKPAEK